MQFLVISVVYFGQKPCGRSTGVVKDCRAVNEEENTEVIKYVLSLKYSFNYIVSFMKCFQKHFVCIPCAYIIIDLYLVTGVQL